MGRLNGKDIPKVAKLLDDTLDFEDLESFVYAAAGARADPLAALRRSHGR
jgi:hypothetical protein